MAKQPDTDRYWSEKKYFVLACAGAAIGLGTLWRFPYVAYENGGGAFIVPYIVSLLVVGFPFVLIEMNAGKWSKGSIVEACNKMGTKIAPLGWWSLVNSLVIVFYYSVVLAWSVCYVFYSVGLNWQPEPSDFFFQSHLELSAGPFDWSGPRLNILLATSGIWLVVWFVASSGLKALSKVLLVTVPLPFFLLLAMGVNSSLQEGGIEGTMYFLRPDFTEIWTPGVWTAAISQVLLTLSLGMGQMIAYSSRTTNDTKISSSAFWVLFSVLVFSVLAGWAIFSTLGVYSSSQEISINELTLDGVVLAFITYPLAISSLPFANFVGVVFFMILVMIGIDSVLAVVEAVYSGLEGSNKTYSRKFYATIICLVGFCGSVFFVIGPGLYWLDIVDHWVANYAIASICILQAILFAKYIPTSLQAGGFIFKSKGGWLEKGFRKVVGVILPIALIFVFGQQLLEDDLLSYGNYPPLAIIFGGWGVFFGSLLLALLWHAHLKRK